MIDELKLHNQRNNGAAAEMELRQTEEAFKKLRQKYADAWLNSDPRDSIGREKIWIATTILSTVESHLRTAAANGEVAEKQIEALRKAGEPAKKRILGLV